MHSVYRTNEMTCWSGTRGREERKVKICDIIDFCMLIRLAYFVVWANHLFAGGTEKEIRQFNCLRLLHWLFTVLYTLTGACVPISFYH